MAPPPHAAEYVATRRIGEALVGVLSDGLYPSVPFLSWLPAPEAALRQAIPEATAQGNLLFGMNVVHVQLGDASVLLDPGWGDLDPANPLVSNLLAQPSPGVEAGLAALGVAPTAITHVVISHAHSDHFLGATVQRSGQLAPRYPHARYLLGRAEWEDNPERTRPDSLVARHLGLLARMGLLDLVDGDSAVVPGITLLHAPGESPGHSIVRVQSAGETFYYVGDLFHHPCEVEHPDWVVPWSEPARTIASRTHLLDAAAAQGATLVCTHRRFSGWFRVVRTATGDRWEDA